MIMTNTTLVICCVVALVIVIIGFIGYSIYTSHIIKDQEREIAKLKTTIKRYEQRGTVYIERDGKNPQFGGF